MDNRNAGPRKLLGVGPHATEKQIKRRHRLLSRKFHPDLNPNDPQAEEKFKRIQWAYECLMNGVKQPHNSGQFSEEPNNSVPMSEASHPFFGFFQAMRTYSARLRRIKDDS